MQDSDTLRTLTLITAPPVEPITLADAKAHLRRDDSDEDDLISALIEAARQHIDGKDGILGRALVEQSWQLALTVFPAGGIRVPLPPLIEVESITYLDTAGAEQTLAESEYQILESEPAMILPAYGKSWPATRCQAEAIKVRFTAGYAPAAGSPTDYRENVPQAIRQAMLLLIAHWYENRGATTERSAMPLPFAVQALLTPYSVAII